MIIVADVARHNLLPLRVQAISMPAMSGEVSDHYPRG